MARRKRQEDVAFGSDSFLDIVANIVGILIILIVIAGVRVSQMPAIDPAVAKNPPPEPTIAAPLLSFETPIVTPDVPPPEVITFKPAPPPQPTPIAPPEPIEASPELLARINALGDELKVLTATKQKLASSVIDKTEAGVRVGDQLASSKTKLMKDQQQLEKGQQAIANLQTDLETGQRNVAGLHMELGEVEASQPAPTVLKHKLTPIGKQVEGKEVHFLLSHNRVSVVPIDELAEKLGEEMSRNRSQILRGNTRVGTVGPVKGFTMEYTVAREAVSLMEELRMGTAIVRVGVSEWRIHPQPDAVFESDNEALRPQSRFLAALRSAGTDATLTFWVNPDSFPLHRELQDFAQINGFDVAARPWPEGIPVAGSTNGSRSMAQ